MSSLTRTIVLLATAAGALAVAVVSLVMMLAPAGDALPSSLVGHLGAGVELALALTGALTALLVSVFALTARSSARRAVSTGLLRTAALVAALVLALTTPGGIIPAAGYTFAATVLVGGAVLIVLVVLRRPWLGLLLAAAVGVLAFAMAGLGFGTLAVQILGGFGSLFPLAAVALTHVVAAAGLLVWSIGESRGARGGFAEAVLRHRRPITIIAAACALPYVIARASWLTPWPLFGGSAELFAQEPAARVLGLVLGAGMLAGGVLTMGLIRPWGERFPRVFAGVGGRPVPPALAIIPASVVSVLFTAAGVQFTLEGAGSISHTAYLLLMFPFWLWGPLLGLAAWGYAMNRETPLVSAAPPVGVVRTR